MLRGLEIWPRPQQLSGEGSRFPVSVAGEHVADKISRGIKIRGEQARQYGG